MSKLPSSPVDDHDLDEVEAVVAEEEDEPVLALPLVRGRLEDVEHLARLLLTHVGVVKVARQLPLQPMGVDVQRAQVLRVLWGEIEGMSILTRVKKSVSS